MNFLPLPRTLLFALGTVFASSSAFGQQPATQSPAQQTATERPAQPTAMSTLTVSPLLTKPVAQLTPEEIASMQRQLEDWPQLARYRDDNVKLGPAAAGEQRVVFMGDSITDAWGRRAGHFFPNRPWVNRGISGQTTPQMLVRFQQDVLQLQPAAVVILAGINDIAGNTGPETLDTIEANLRSMVALARQAHVRVVLSSVLPAAAFPWHPGVDPRDEVVALNRWIAQYAASEHLTFLDYYPALVGPDRGMRAGHSFDGVHPNDAGYAIMEPLAEAAVQKALAQPQP